MRTCPQHPPRARADQEVNLTTIAFGRISGRFARFGAVGALGVVINNAVLLIAHALIGLPLLLASPIAVEVAIVHNFIWNEHWTFGTSHFSLKRLGKFNLTSLGGLAITSGVMYTLVSYFGIHYIVANLVGIGVATVWNFTTSLVWTWAVDR